MPIFKIPVVWQMAGTMEIEADTLEQAEEIALGPAPLPTDGEYLTASCQLDVESYEYGEIVEE